MVRSARSCGSTPSTKTCWWGQKGPLCRVTTRQWKAQRAGLALTPRGNLVSRYFAQHDAQMDYYGKKLATCSSDRTIRVFEMEDEGFTQIGHLKGWGENRWFLDDSRRRRGARDVRCAFSPFSLVVLLCWSPCTRLFLPAQPRWSRLGACLGAPTIWCRPCLVLLRRAGNNLEAGRREVCQHQGAHRTHRFRKAPGGHQTLEFTLTHPLFLVNSIQWAPHELGPHLACGSSDGKVSVLSYRDYGHAFMADLRLVGSFIVADDATWDVQVFDAHAVGCNAVSWAPARQASSGPAATRHLASAGCDNAVKIWSWNGDSKKWTQDDVLEGHTDWVRDLSWSPSVGLPKSYLAS
ncbi:MAG: WD40-repeat-containing domain protein, partial [Olpidium bornovanus]